MSLPIYILECSRWILLLGGALFKEFSTFDMKISNMLHVAYLVFGTVCVLSTADLLYSLLSMNTLTERSPRRRRRHHKSAYHSIKSKCKIQNIIIISILIWIVVSIYFVGSLRGGGYIDGMGIRQHLRGGSSNRQYDNVWIRPDSQPFVSFILQFIPFAHVGALTSIISLPHTLHAT